MTTLLRRRAMDLCALTLFGPAAAGVAAGVYLVSLSLQGRPVLFAQQRVGRDGKRFEALKFRTMRPSADGPKTTAAGDPRITPLGRVLRKWKLDELPQLLNVVRGEMSLVGPRPEVPEYVDLDDIQWRRILSVRPGITDWTTLILRNEEAILDRLQQRGKGYRDLLPLKLEIGVEYLERSTTWSDLMILCTTALAVIGASPPTDERIESL